MQTEVEYDSALKILTPDVPNETARRALAEMYRGLRRSLLQEFHPDRPGGGDAEAFNRVKRAYSVGDYAYLEYLYRTRIEARSLVWRTGKGFIYIEKLVETAHQRHELLRNTPEFFAVLAHRQGNKERALHHVTQILMATAKDLEIDVAQARFSAGYTAPESTL